MRAVGDGVPSQLRKAVFTDYFFHLGFGQIGQQALSDGGGMRVIDLANHSGAAVRILALQYRYVRHQPFIQNSDVHRFAAADPQVFEQRSGQSGHSLIRQYRPAEFEKLRSEHVLAGLFILVHVPDFFHGVQQPVNGGFRQADRLRDLLQCDRLLGILAEGFQDSKNFVRQCDKVFVACCRAIWERGFATCNFHSLQRHSISLNSV